MTDLGAGVLAIGTAHGRGACDPHHRIPLTATLLTVTPGAEPNPAGGMRPPHTRLAVSPDVYRLVVPMYFADEAINGEWTKCTRQIST
jgi:hypothetical protein